MVHLCQVCEYMFCDNYSWCIDVRITAPHDPEDQPGRPPPLSKYYYIYDHFPRVGWRQCAINIAVTGRLVY